MNGRWTKWARATEVGEGGREPMVGDGEAQTAADQRIDPGLTRAEALAYQGTVTGRCPVS